MIGSKSLEIGADSTCENRRKLEFSPEDLEALSHWRFHHPHPHVQLKMEVVYLRSQKLENNQIQRLCGISKATFYRYLREYQAGGVLREGRRALQEHAERLIIWPVVRNNRTAALAHFDQLLGELDNYLEELGEWKGPSAIALKDITNIKDDIEKIKAGISGPKAFEDRIDNLLMNLDKSRLLSTSGNCGRVIEALRIAFR